MLRNLINCILYTKNILGIYNLVIAGAYIILYLTYRQVAKWIRKNRKKIKCSDFIRRHLLGSKKTFYFFWSTFIVLNFIPISCITKHKVEELNSNVVKFQKLLIEASSIMKMSKDYYEELRKEMIQYPPNVRFSTTLYQKRRKRDMRTFISEDIGNNRKCLSFIQNIKRENTPTAYTYITEQIELLKEANKNICKNSYYISYLIGLDYLKLNKLTKDKLTESDTYLKKAIETATKKGILDYTLYDTYAEVLLLLGNYDKAEEFLKKTLCIYPSHPYADAQLRIVGDLKKLSNHEKQIQEFKTRLATYEQKSPR